MNFKLIFFLSLIGFVMAFATISMIPEEIEWIIWLLIFAFNAIVIANTCNDRFFWYGFLVALANCFWLTFIHIIFYDTYNLNHTASASVGNYGYFSHHARHLMLALSPIYGIVFGVAQGVFAYLFARLARRGSRRKFQRT